MAETSPSVTTVSASAKHDGGPLEAAFVSLAKYTAGSSRGALVLLDQAVAAAAGDPAAAVQLSQRLATMLEGSAPVPAKRYVCEKLALIGGADAVPHLARWLDDPALTDAARTALQAIPGKASSRALIDALRRLQGIPRLGVMASLGMRRERIAVGPLSRLVTHADRPTGGAALGALGDIGSVEAARVLKVYLEREPVVLRVEAALAALACAQQLRRAGNAREAAALVAVLDGPGLPEHVLQSAK